MYTRSDLWTIFPRPERDEIITSNLRKVVNADAGVFRHLPENRLSNFIQSDSYSHKKKKEADILSVGPERAFLEVRFGSNPAGTTLLP